MEVVYLNVLFVSLCQALGQCGQAKKVTFFPRFFLDPFSPPSWDPEQAKIEGRSRKQASKRKTRVIWGRGCWWGKKEKTNKLKEKALPSLFPIPARFYIISTTSHCYLGTWDRLVICLIAQKVEFFQARVFRGVVSPPVPEKYDSLLCGRLKEQQWIQWPFNLQRSSSNNRFVLVTRGTSHRMFPELVSINLSYCLQQELYQIIVDFVSSSAKLSLYEEGKGHFISTLTFDLSQSNSQVILNCI